MAPELCRATKPISRAARRKQRCHIVVGLDNSGLLSDPEAGRVAQVFVVALYKAGYEADRNEGGEAGQKNDHHGNP